MIETLRFFLLERGLERGCRFMITANFLDDMRVNAVFNRFGCYPEGVLDRERGAGAVRDDANAVDAKERTATVLLVVCLSLDVVKSVSLTVSAIQLRFRRC